MKKADFIRKIANEKLEGGYTLGAVDDVVKATFEAIAEIVAEGDDISIPHFGKFERIHKEARLGRNPQTGETIEIPSRYSVKFKASSAFKDAVK